MGQQNKRYMIVAFLLVAAAMISACGSGIEKNNGGNSGNGAIRFSLEWPSPYASPLLSELRGPMFAPSGDVCQDYQIENISVNIYTTANSLITNQTFSCSAHTGFVAVAPGSYNITVDGIGTGGADNWRGQKTGITVNDGTATDAGAVTMSYIGTDSVKPSVASTTPTNNATDVPVSNAITAVFSEDMAAFTIDTSTFVLTRGTVTVLGTVSYTSASKTASFLPSTQLSTGTVYTATITTGAKDLALNALAANYSWSFTTITSGGGGGSSNWDALIWDTDVWN